MPLFADGFNYLKARGTSRMEFFKSKFPEIPGPHFTDLGRMKGCINLGATVWFWTLDPWIGSPVS